MKPEQVPTPSAYAYPLLIKQLLHTPLAVAPDQEIIYSDKQRHTYRELDRRIRRLANALTNAGVKKGMTVGVMDWDSHRYLECFFGVPMLGAVLQTVNVRLSSEQILYTINHALAEDGHISQYAIPEHVQFVEQLSRTSVGKLNKRALREQVNLAAK